MSTESEQQDVLIVTGMSGAGRSTAANALEDLGWYVVDNLPPQMLRPLVDLAKRAGDTLPKIAAVVDVRGRDFFEDLGEIVRELRAGVDLRMVFLEATDAVLVRRFEQVRRPHPLQGHGTLLDGITAERTRLAQLRESADIVIDTSDLNIHQLATSITDRFAEAGRAGLQVTVMSFGFKYGLPTDVDMVADARFLPNPYWIPEFAPAHGPRRRGERLRAGPAGRRGVHRLVLARFAPRARRLPAREQAPRDHRRRLHGRQAPLRRGRRPYRRPAR